MSDQPKSKLLYRKLSEIESCRSCECSFRRGYEHAVCAILDELDRFNIPARLRTKLERYADKVHDWRISGSGFELPPNID